MRRPTTKLADGTKNSHRISVTGQPEHISLYSSFLSTWICDVGGVELHIDP